MNLLPLILAKLVIGTTFSATLHSNPSFNKCSRVIMQAAGAQKPTRIIQGDELIRLKNSKLGGARVLSGNAEITNLKDATYLFVMDSNLRVAIVERHFWKGGDTIRVKEAIRALLEDFDAESTVEVDQLPIPYAGSFTLQGGATTSVDFDVEGFEPDDYLDGLDLMALEQLEEYGLAVVKRARRDTPRVFSPPSAEAHQSWAAVFQNYDLNSAPSILERSHIQRRPREIISTGTLVENSRSFDNLKEGTYVFLVAKNFPILNSETGEIEIRPYQGIFSHRYPILRPQQKLIATHRSLLQKLLDINAGKTLEIVSAGEWLHRAGSRGFGQAVRWGNKAGSFPIRNSRANLNFGVAYFAQAGLWIPENALVSDASLDIRGSAIGPPHLREEQEAIIRVQLNARKDLRERRQTLETLRNVLARVAPHPKFAAMLDPSFSSKIEAARDAIYLAYRDLKSKLESIRIEDRNELEAKVSLLKTAHDELSLVIHFIDFLEKEGPDFVIARLFKRGPFPNFVAQFQGSQARAIRKLLMIIRPFAQAAAVERGTLDQFANYPTLRRPQIPLKPDPILP